MCTTYVLSNLYSCLHNINYMLGMFHIGYLVQHMYCITCILASVISTRCKFHLGYYAQNMYNICTVLPVF